MHIGVQPSPSSIPELFFFDFATLKLCTYLTVTPTPASPGPWQSPFHFRLLTWLLYVPHINALIQYLIFFVTGLFPSAQGLDGSYLLEDVSESPPFLKAE